MGLEFVLLLVLFIIFLISFCGLLQKIKQTYQQERIIAERQAQREAHPRFGDAFLNSVFADDNNRPFNEAYEGVFPGSPPPYTQYYADPPPKYEDLFKNENPSVCVVDETQRRTDDRPIDRSERSEIMNNSSSNRVNNNNSEIVISTISV